MNNHPTITGYDFTIDKPLPRPDAVRAHCKECRPDNSPRSCGMAQCKLFSYRKTSPLESKLNRTKSIRKYCLECQCGSISGVNHCDIVDCHLWPYRVPRRGVQLPHEGFEKAPIEQKQSKENQTRVTPYRGAQKSNSISCGQLLTLNTEGASYGN